MPRIFKRAIPTAMCNGCTSRIVDALKEALGDNIDEKDIKLNLPARSCILTLPDSISDDEIERILDDAGFPPFQAKSDIPALFLRGFIGIYLGLILLILSTAGIIMPLLLAIFITSLSAAYLAPDTYQSLRQSWVTKQITADTLFAISMLTMLIISTIGLAFPALGIKLLLDMMLLSAGIKHASTALQKHMQKDTPDSVLDRIPPEQTVTLRDGSKVASQDLKPGDEIVLSRGDYVPVDVTCITECVIDNTMMDGQDSGAVIKKGAPLKQGMLIHFQSQQEQYFQVTATYTDSSLNTVDRSIKTLQHQDKNVSKVIQWFIPAVIVITAVAAVILWHFVAWPMVLNTAIFLLTSACPCTIGLNQGLATQVTKAKLREAEIECRNIKVSQNKITDVFFDFTNTLMEPIDPLTDMNSIDFVSLENTPDKLKKIIYSLEKNESNTYAQAICAKLLSENRALAKEVKNPKLDKKEHSGVAATLDDGIHYCIGNENRMQGNVEHYKEIIRQQEKEKKLAADCQYIYIEEGVGDTTKLIGYIKVHFRLRPGAKEAIESFQEKKIDVHICTGADENTVRDFLKHHKITDIKIRANRTALPGQEKGKQDKLTDVQTLQTEGKGVLFIGDGANDIAPLLQCDIGVAMESPVADAMTQSVANFSIRSFSELFIQLEKIQPILQEAAQLKNRNDKISIGLNLLMLLIPIILIGCGVSCPPCLGPLLMWVPFAITRACMPKVPEPLVPHRAVEAKQAGVNTATMSHTLQMSPQQRKSPIILKEERTRYRLYAGTADPTLVHSSLAHRPSMVRCR